MEKKKIRRNKNLRHLPENDNSYLDTMTGTNSFNDRLILRRNVEINSNWYFLMTYFREWNRRPRGMETPLRNHQEKCLSLEIFQIPVIYDFSWFIERSSMQFFIYSSFVTTYDVNFPFFTNFPS